MNPKVQDLINQIKERAAGLEFMEDGLAFDKYVGELDLLLYELRTVAWKLPEKRWETALGPAIEQRAEELNTAAWKLPKGVKAYRVDDMDQWINELIKELGS